MRPRPSIAFSGPQRLHSRRLRSNSLMSLYEDLILGMQSTTPRYAYMRAGKSKHDRTGRLLYMDAFISLVARLS